MFELKSPDLLGKVASALQVPEKLVLTCHVRPDGDAIGSMLGLGAALESAGKQVVYYCQDEPNQTLSFLPGFHKLVHEPPRPFPDDAALVVLDCSEADRIGRHGQEMVDQADMLIVIDHHLGQDMCGGLEDGKSTRCAQYINPDIFATAAICFAIVEQLGWDVSPEIATNFYAAILTDTGCFRHSNTTSLAFRMAARLVEYGADPYMISDMLYERVPYRKLVLLSRALGTLSVELDGKVALLHVTPEMLEQTGGTVQDTDDFVRYARCIDGVEVSAFIKEVESGRVSVSMRSRSWFNVAEVAKGFGGGGHFHAAGFRQPGTAEQWRSRLLDIIAPLLKGHEAGDRADA